MSEDKVSESKMFDLLDMLDDSELKISEEKLQWLSAGDTELLNIRIQTGKKVLNIIVDADYTWHFLGSSKKS